MDDYHSKSKVYIRIEKQHYLAFDKEENFICADAELQVLLDKLENMGYNKTIFLEKKILKPLIKNGVKYALS